MLRSRIVAVVALVAAGGAAAMGLAACGGGSASSHAAGCQAPIQEATDPRSTLHLFPGTPDPAYLSDPPTSGPHRLGPSPTGVVRTPIQRSRQVRMLELGYVILQYHDLPPASVAALAVFGRMAGPLVTVAPAAGPLPDRIVATAWTWKLVCGEVQPAPLQAFIAAHRGVGFSHGGFGPTSTTTTAAPAAP